MTDRDYAALLPRVLAKLFPEGSARRRADAILESYGPKSHHIEVDRVRLGILRLAGTDLTHLERWTALARTDFRDLLLAAEYPRTSGHGALQERDPKRYAVLAKQERAEYEAWLATVLADPRRVGE